MSADGDWDLLDDADSLGVLSLESDCEEPSSPLSAGASAVIEAAEEQQGPELGQLQDLLSSVVASAQLAGSAATSDCPPPLASPKPDSADASPAPAPEPREPTDHQPTINDDDADAELAAAAGKAASKEAPPATPASAAQPAKPLASLHVLLLQLLLGAAATAVVLVVVVVAPGGAGPPVMPVTAPHQQSPVFSSGPALPPAAAVEGFPRLQELWALALASHSPPAHINATLARLVRIAQHKRARALQAHLQQLDPSISRKAPAAGAAARQSWTNSTAGTSSAGAPVNKPRGVATCVNVWSRMLARPGRLLQQLMLPAAARRPMLSPPRPAPAYSNTTSCAVATAVQATTAAASQPAGAAVGATAASTRAFLNATAGGSVVHTASASRGSMASQVGSSVAAMAAAVVQSGSSAWQRITRPSKPVPALYRPAPPCLMVVVPHRQLAQRPAALQAPVKPVPALYRPAPPCLMVVPGQKPAAPAGGGLTLPMLAPLVFAAPPATPAAARDGAGPAAAVRGAAANTSSTCRTSDEDVADSGSSSSRFGQFLLQMGSSKDAAEAGSAPALPASGGLTLPMLPPIAGVGVPGASGGLTLPMLPPVMCRTCGADLQLLPARSSKRPAPAAAAVAVAAAVPTAKAGKGTVASAMRGQALAAPVSPAVEPPTCLAPATSTCPAPNKRRSESPATKATAAQKNATHHRSRSSKHNATSATSSTKGVWVSSWPSPPVLLPAPVQPARAVAPAAPEPRAGQQEPEKLSCGASTNRRAYGAPETAALGPAQPAKASAAATTTTEAPVPCQAPHAPAGSSSALSSKLHKLAGAADRLQQPVKQLMHLLSAASKRSLQCAPPAAPPGSSNTATFNFQVAAAGGHRRALFSSAYAANSAAYAAAAELLAAASAVEDGADAAARRSYSSYGAPLPAQTGRELQQQCWAVGLAHRGLQVAVGAAVFSPAPSRANAGSISAFAQPAPAPAAGMFPADPASNSAGSGSGRTGRQRGSAAMPLGPAGALWPVSSQSAATPGPLLALQHQLAAGSTSRRLAPASRLSSSGLVAAAKGHTAGSGAAKLKAGWDRHSAWQAAQLAAEAGKAEARLQQTCQQLLRPSEAVVAAA